MVLRGPDRQESARVRDAAIACLAVDLAIQDGQPHGRLIKYADKDMHRTLMPMAVMARQIASRKAAIS